MKKKNPKIELGNCFQYAAQYMLRARGKDMLLVHSYATGTGVQNKGIRFSHAWIEDGDIVIDPSESKTDPIIARKEKYYMAGKIKADEGVRYTIDEMIDKMTKHENYGPWDLKPTKEEILVLALTNIL